MDNTPKKINFKDHIIQDKMTYKLHTPSLSKKNNKKKGSRKGSKQNSRKGSKKSSRKGSKTTKVSTRNKPLQPTPLVPVQPEPLAPPAIPVQHLESELQNLVLDQQDDFTPIDSTTFIRDMIAQGRKDDVYTVLKRVSRLPDDVLEETINPRKDDITVCLALAKRAPARLVSEQRPGRRSELLEWLVNGAHAYKSYLDVGCGDMTLTQSVKDNFVIPGGTVGAVDVVMPKKIPLGVQFKRSDGHLIPFPDRSFELVTMFHAMHHFEYLDDMLRELDRVTTPGATLVIREHDCARGQPCYDAISLMHVAYDIIHHDMIPKQPIHMSRLRTEWESILGALGWTPGRINTTDSIDRLYTQTFYKKQEGGRRKTRR